MTHGASNIYHKSFEVRWDDVDFNGHLRSTRYLEYASTTRVGFLKSVGWGTRTLMQEGITPVLLGEEIRYLREVFMSEIVNVSCEIAAQTEDASRSRIRHVVEREDGAEAAVVHSLGAWMDVRSRKITVPPAGLREALESIQSADCEVLGA